MLTKNRSVAALRATTIAWVLAVCVGLPGCASSGSNQRTNIKTPVGEIEINTQAGQFHVKIPAGTRGTITFKDSDGNTIPGGITADGPIDQDFPLPEGYASYDYDITTKPAPATPQVPFTANSKTMAGSMDAVVTPKLYPYSLNCTSNYIDDTSLHGFCHGVTTWAAGSGGAWSKFDAVSLAGPGGVVPAGTQVDTWVDVQAGAIRFTIGSALQDTFSQFTVTVDGVVYADLATNLNVVVQPLANGWTKVWTALPNTLAGSNSTVILTQKGSAPTAAESLIEIGHL